MADLQQPVTQAATSPVVLADTRDDDYALGCESADPALQIERWAEQLQVPPADSH